MLNIIIGAIGIIIIISLAVMGVRATGLPTDAMEWVLFICLILLVVGSTVLIILALVNGINGTDNNAVISGVSSVISNLNTINFLI